MLTGLGCGKNRQALNEPPETQKKLEHINELLALSKQEHIIEAYKQIENTELRSKENKARIYERIAKKTLNKNSEIMKNSLSKAIKLYTESGKKERAQYLRKQINTELANHLK